MRLLICCAIAGLGAATAAEPNTLSPEEKAAGFRLLFNGKDFAGWDAPGGNWEARDGAMVWLRRGGGITYQAEKIPDDFELRFEWKVAEGSNSGVYYRPGQYEYQVLDNRKHPDGREPRTSAASLYYFAAPSRDATRPVGQWNEGRIVCLGTRIEHWLNGEKVVDLDYSRPEWAEAIDRLRKRGADIRARGAYLFLQDHGDAVWYRSIRLREIETGTKHRLVSTAKTVHWGYYDAGITPVLRVRSGDTVRIRSSMIASPEMLEGAGLPAAEIEPSLREIYQQVKERGPGPHILTGPVYIEGAESGDVLEVRIQAIELGLSYALNIFMPGLGTLPEDFPYARVKVYRLDGKRMVGEFAVGIEIPLRPFFGSMGVAPPAEVGRISSAPPWVHAGNLDNKEMVAGTTLYIPVHARGALFSVGDAHAAQGNGEVDLAALETALEGTFRFVVRKDLKLHWPRAETPTHWITMGFDEDLDQAAKIATREMVDWLAEWQRMSRDDAYMLASVAADLSVTQLVDGKKGIHAMIPKNIFRRR